MDDKKIARMLTKAEIVQNPEPSAGFSRCVQLDGMDAKVLVQIRNGYLSTGSSEVNRLLPNSLRRLQDGRWISSLGEIQKDLGKLDAIKVVEHFRSLKGAKSLDRVPEMATA
jgi:hypothetical protein